MSAVGVATATSSPGRPSFMGIEGRPLHNSL